MGGAKTVIAVQAAEGAHAEQGKYPALKPTLPSGYTKVHAVAVGAHDCVHGFWVPAHRRKNTRLHL